MNTDNSLKTAMGESIADCIADPAQRQPIVEAWWRMHQGTPPAEAISNAARSAGLTSEQVVEGMRRASAPRPRAGKYVQLNFLKDLQNGLNCQIGGKHNEK
ncbi:MAG: hypothetical protein O2901_11595 [Verrucomicrobia bacterium]|nr:hypothetical protein [Verrucomicrobiota bacterium]